MSSWSKFHVGPSLLVCRFVLVAIGRLGRRVAARRSSLSLSDDGTGCLDPECPAWHAATAAPQRDGRIVAAIPQRSFTLGLPLHCAPCCFERCSVYPESSCSKSVGRLLGHFLSNWTKVMCSQNFLTLLLTTPYPITYLLIGVGHRLSSSSEVIFVFHAASFSISIFDPLPSSSAAD